MNFADTNYGFIIYTQSQDDKITSDALSRCQKNQKNPGPGPRDLLQILDCVDTDERHIWHTGQYFLRVSQNDGFGG